MPQKRNMIKRSEMWDILPGTQERGAKRKPSRRFPKHDIVTALRATGASPGAKADFLQNRT